MVAGRTQSHADLTADAVHDQITGVSTLDHEVCRFFQVVMTTRIFVTVVDGCCSSRSNLSFSGLCGPDGMSQSSCIKRAGVFIFLNSRSIGEA